VYGIVHFGMALLSDLSGQILKKKGVASIVPPAGIGTDVALCRGNMRTLLNVCSVALVAALCAFPAGNVVASPLDEGAETVRDLDSSATALDREVSGFERDIARAQELERNATSRVQSAEEAVSAHNPGRARGEIRSGLDAAAKGEAVLESAAPRYREAKRLVMQAHEMRSDLADRPEAKKRAAQVLERIDAANDRAEELNDRAAQLRHSLRRARQSLEDYDRDLRAEAEDDEPRPFAHRHWDDGDMFAAWCAANVCLNLLPLVIDIAASGHGR
jgi:hypothetical protein